LDCLIPAGKTVGFYLLTRSRLSYLHSLVSENAIPANSLIISRRPLPATAASTLLDPTRSSPQGAKKAFTVAVSNLLVNPARVIYCVLRETELPLKQGDRSPSCSVSFSGPSPFGAVFLLLSGCNRPPLPRS